MNDADTSPPSETELRQQKGPHSVNAVTVRFRVPGQTQLCDAGSLDLKPWDDVIVESDRGTRVAHVLGAPKVITTEKSLRAVIRLATDADLKIVSHNRTREREAFRYCAERIRILELPMKLMSVDWSHSGSKAVFYFVSGDRVDFRVLVKDLARRFHTRIEMRQIGVRDAARHTGGTGLCGRHLCCAGWIPEFKPISIRMAKDQNLTLNQDKLSGTCGRLRCCLRYEQDTYHSQRKSLPKVGKRILTPDGEGRVRDINVIKQRVRVQLVDGRYADYDAGEVKRPDPTPPARTKEARTAARPTSTESDRCSDKAAAENVPQGAADDPQAAAGERQESSGKKRRRRRRRRGGKGRKPSPPGEAETEALAPTGANSRQDDGS